MLISRRTALTRCAAGAALFAAAPSLASAETATYGYDEHGRLVSVTFGDGRVVRYTYDDAGNRLVASRGTTASAFSATVQVLGTAPVNLRTLAEANGYTGQTNATITFEVGGGVTITGAPGARTYAPMAGGTGGIAIDTGGWPTGSHTIALTLVVKTGGKVYGGGAAGGQAGYTTSAGAGGVGGDAVYCRTPISITVQSGGEIKAGGGGAGGGGGWLRVTSENLYYSGGGGGGGFPNGAGGDIAQSADVSGSPGANGTAGGGGAGGGGVGAGPGRTTGAGGVGGAAAASGAAGAVSSGTADANNQKIGQGGGGVAGYAIRKNGNTVPVTNNGTISGTQA